MVSEHGNVALVTKTLVHNAALALTDPGHLDLPRFLDFSSLCEAAVLLDELQVLQSSDRFPNSPILAALNDNALLTEGRLTLLPDDLRRLAMQLPDDLSRRLLPSFWNIGPDQRSERDVGPTGFFRDIKYAVKPAGLLQQIDDIVNYPSLTSGPDTAGRVLRGNAYLVLAAANGLDYFPDYDRVPFVAAMLSKLYRSLPMQLYTRIAEALELQPPGNDKTISEWTLRADLPIPPITALVLHQSRTLAEVPASLLAVRDEFAKYREHFRSFKAELQSVDSFKKRRELRRKYEELLRIASGPDAEIVSATEVLNFSEKLLKTAAAPALPTSYSAALLTQPAEWIKRWWLRRPLAVLYRLDGKLPRLSEYRQLIRRLWGAAIGDDILAQYATHSAQVKQLLTAA